MITVGITGVMGSGKSTLSNLLQNHYPVISADEISHQLQTKGQAGYKAIVKRYSDSILNDQNEIDRKKLADIVFNNAQEKKSLEEIMHPLIKEEIDKRISMMQDKKICFVEVPLLFERDWDQYFDYTVTISGNLIEIKKRLMKERNLSLEQIEERMSQQYSQQEKESKADFIIKNEGTIADLEKKVIQLIEQLKRKF